MTKHRTRTIKQGMKPDQGPINPYVPESDADLQEEKDALEYEQPSFACPELDALLEGIEREAERMMSLYRLDDDAGGAGA